MADRQSIKYWTKWTLFVITVILFVLWTVLQFYEFSSTSVTHLTNSKGEVCGEGENQGREHLLYYDIPKCAGLEAGSEHCKSAQVRPCNSSKNLLYSVTVCRGGVKGVLIC